MKQVLLSNIVREQIHSSRRVRQRGLHLNVIHASGVTSQAPLLQNKRHN